jgi:cytochrome P450
MTAIDLLGHEALADPYTRWASCGRLRQASEDLELGGHTIRGGERVLLVLAAANRDPRAFTDPDGFDVHRDAGRHLGFGYGIHFCIGAPLARLEAHPAAQPHEPSPAPAARPALVALCA